MKILTRNLEALWDLFEGKYLTTQKGVADTMGLGYEAAGKLLEPLPTLQLTARRYYRVLDVIDAIEGGFTLPTPPAGRGPQAYR